MNSTGNIKMSQMLVPFAPWIDAIPKSATSEEVSKPRPNITPKGYLTIEPFLLALRDLALCAERLISSGTTHFPRTGTASQPDID